MDESLSKRLAALRRKHSEEQLARAQALAKEKRDATAAAAASAAGKKNKASSSSLSPSFPGLMVGGSTGKSEATIALSRALAEDSNRRKAAAKEKEFVDPRELSGGGKVGGSVGERGESGERRERADTTTTTGTGTGGSAVGSLGPSAQGKAKGGHGAQVPSPLETPQHGDVDDEQNIGDIPQLPQTQAEEVEHQLRLQQQHEEAATEEYEEEPEPLDLDPEFELDLDDMEYILDHDPNDGIPAWLNPSYSYDDDGEDDTANTNTNYPDEPHTAGNQGDDGDGDENADAENDDDDLNFTPFEDVPSLPDFPLLPSYPRREQPTSAPRTIDLEIRPAPPGRPQPPQFHSQLQDSSSNSNINDEDVITPPPPPQKVESAEDLMEQRFLALASGLRIQHGAQPSQQQSQQHPAALRDDDLRQRFKRVLEGRHVAGSSTGGVIGGSSEVWDDEGWVGGDSVDQDLSVITPPPFHLLPLKLILEKFLNSICIFFMHVRNVVLIR
ncbi:hypothetical protein DFH27DRAFT_337595 [Peziza echinospora]|nr:hypothetical protein DFH27DRAFT_337595 [Peziza echinospora]